MEREIRQKVHGLWDNLSGFGAARVEDALQYLLLELCSVVKAQRAYWMGIVRVGESECTDPAQGWRLRALHRSWGTPLHDQVYREHWRRIESGDMDPLIAADLRHVGQFRINSLRQHVDDDWYRSGFYNELYAPLGIRDVVHVAIPLGMDVESWFGFERLGNTEPFFSDLDRQILGDALRPLKWFQQQVVLHRGVVLGMDALTPAECRVLGELLTHKTEREIADELSLTPTTVHTYCMRICRKYNVRGRSGLTALWLGQLPDEVAFPEALAG